MLTSAGLAVRHCGPHWIASATALGDPVFNGTVHFNGCLLALTRSSATT